MNELLKESIVELLPLCEDTKMLDFIHQLLAKSIDNSLRHVEPVIRDAV